QFSGVGGPSMEKISKSIRNWTDDSAVVGFWEVIKKYRFFKGVFDQVLDEIESIVPDTVVLVDYPGFNLRLAEAIKKRGIQTKIVYYISPQVWAWKRGRVTRMAKVIDLMLCLFPFEVSFYERSGLEAQFVGHPLSEALEKFRSDSKRDNELIALLPGSRDREVEKIFPLLLGAASEIKKIMPKMRFAASAANRACEEKMKDMVQSSGVPCKVSVGKSHELMSVSCCGAVASGTATLEAAFLGLPYCLVYKVSAFTYYLAKGLIAVNFLGMANILAGRELVRELIQYDASPEKIASEILRLIGSKEKRELLSRELKEITEPLAEVGAYDRAAIATIGVIKNDVTNSA
ncbi:lipid-A-disaccharide synthase, partial [Verrucomicrobiales bacterium]|nr:lipid-A-disaccharide synthase [Verrucomicrobiales bacterium]